MESSDDDRTEAVQWLLGFLQQPSTPYALLRHRFKSKVGGRPAWLNPSQLPTREQLTCPATGQPLLFLLQAYAPPEGADHAFHRILMVFISPVGDRLTEPGMVRALRCQLPLHNPYYAPTPDSQKLPRQAQPDSPDCDPWRVSAWEEACRAQQPLPDAQGVQLLAEHELVVEPEEDSEDDEATLAGMLQQQRLTGDHQVSGDDDLGADMAAVEAQTSPDQQHFARFAARVAHAPEQVLRYCFDTEAAPLWPSPPAEGQPHVPPCPLCQGPRQFELQVMPQLLNYLGVPADAKHAPDWGSIAVYSCAASCRTEKAYVDEFVFVQP